LEPIAETQPPTPTGFTEIVGDDFPVLHRRLLLLIVQNGVRCRLAQFKLCAYFLQASSKRFDCFPNCTSNLHLLRVREECAARCKTGFVWNTYRVLT
jgi:hypothetical protein